MGYHENIWINNYNNSKPIDYKRYVDAIFCVFNNEEEAMLFFEYLNEQHPNIKFTFELEQHGKLPFLDVLVDKKEGGGFYTSVYHKQTYTGLLTNFLSYIPMSYKLSLVKTLIHRIYCICNTWELISTHLQELKEILGRNLYPQNVIDKEIRKYINRKYENKGEEPKTKPNNFYKLPYYGLTSKTTGEKIKKLCIDFCKNTSITLSFSVTKIGSYFSTKSKVPSAVRSFVVYEFTCFGCGAKYIGETTRHLAVRIKEHLKTKKESNVFQHLNQNIKCKDKCSEKCFKVIDRGNSEFILKLKEAIHIKWQKPSLNKQNVSINLSLTV